MSIQACDDNNDKIIYINSTFRTAGTISDYTIQLDKGIENVDYIELIDTTVEYSDVIFRNGGMKFSITRYNIVTLNNVNVLTEAGILTKMFHPYVHNTAQAIVDFNDMFNNIAVAVEKKGSVLDDYSYVTLSINNDILCNNDIVVIHDQNRFLSNYFNIPYEQIIIANPTKVLNGVTINTMSFVKKITSATPMPYNFIYYINPTVTALQLISKETFLYTQYLNPRIPLQNEQYSEPLKNKSIAVFLETINGVNIDLVNTAGGLFNNCFYVHDNTSQRIRNISTAAMSIMGISSVARELPHIRFYFNTPTTIHGFKVRLIYSDGTPYVVNEMNQTGKSTIVLKAHSK